MVVARRSHQQRAAFLNAGDSRLVQLSPLLGTDFDVLRQTLAVKPRIAAMDVTHIVASL